MQKTFEAVYENGVLRPLEPLPISNMQHVFVTISGVPAIAAGAAGYFESENGKRQNTTILALTRFDGLWRQFRAHSQML